MLKSITAAVCTVALLATASTATPPDKAPWSAQPTSGITEEPVTIRARGAVLRGTLYLPKHVRPIAAVVVVHGASSPLRSSPLYDHLRVVLPAIGIAVLVYDRRGSGQSTGNPNSGDSPLLADDAISALELLRRDPRIDPRRVGIWGLSQGGWLSLLAASRSPHVAFAISISAPIVTPDVQMLFSSINTLRVNGYGEADIAQMRETRLAVDNYMRGTDTHAHAQSLVDSARTQPWFKYLYMGKTIGDRETSSWRKEISLDPLRVLDGVTVPTLMLYGSADPVVPVAISVDRLRNVATSHPRMVVDVIAGADHGMQMSVDPKDLLDPDKADAERPDSQEYIATLASWLTRIGVATGSPN